MFSRRSRAVSRNTLRLAVEPVEAGATQTGGTRAESQGCMAIHPKPAREIESGLTVTRCATVCYCGIAGSNGHPCFCTPRKARGTGMLHDAFVRHLESDLDPCCIRPGNPFTFSYSVGPAVQEDTSVSPPTGLLFSVRFGETC